MATKFKAADGYYYVKYKAADGRWRSKFCGKAATASDAEAIRKTYDGQELNRRHSAAIRIVDVELYEQIKLYSEAELIRGGTKSENTIKRYRGILETFESFLRLKGCRSISDATAGIVAEFFDHLAGKSRSASTLSLTRQVVTAFFAWGISRSFLHTNPADGIAKPKRSPSKPRFLTEDELRRIIGGATGPYPDVFRFLYLTGLRIGELCNLQWGDYVADPPHIIIRVMDRNKTKREEVVQLNADAVGIVESRKAAGGDPHYIFVNAQGGPLDNANIYNALKTITKREKIRDVSPHTFRHTCASHLAIKGVSLYIIKEILRHASIKETEKYAHLSKEAVATAIQKLSI